MDILGEAFRTSQTAQEFGNMTQTRTIQHADGSVEIIRVLNDATLISFEEWDPIAYEASIVWLEDINQIDFVRFMLATTCETRTGKLIPQSNGRILGYSKLTVDAPTNPNGFYTRRIFFRFAGDDNCPHPPKDVIDPLTIAPGERGAELAKSRIPVLKRWRSKISDPRVEAAVQGRNEVETQRNREALLGALVPETGDPTLLNSRQLLIGRDRFSDLTLPNPTVSSQHCRLNFDSGMWSITDLGSTAGTWVNGAMIRAHEAVILNSGDRIAVGGFQVKIEY